MSQVFMVNKGVPLFSQKKIEIHMQNSMKSICISQSLLAELQFSQKRLPSWKTAFVKVKVREGQLISGYGFPRKNPFLRKLKLS